MTRCTLNVRSSTTISKSLYSSEKNRRPISSDNWPTWCTSPVAAAGEKATRLISSILTSFYSTHQRYFVQQHLVAYTAAYLVPLTRTDCDVLAQRQQRTVDRSYCTFYLMGIAIEHFHDIFSRFQEHVRARTGEWIVSPSSCPLCAHALIFAWR